MPNRILRDGILTSEKISLLTWAEEIFFRRLMSIVDDYGRCEANAAVLRARLYPLQVDKVCTADIGKWILATVEAGLCKFYSVGNKSYLSIENFGQQIRTASKHPPPPNDIKCYQMLSNDIKCYQMKSFAHLDGVGDGVDIKKDNTFVLSKKKDNFSAPKQIKKFVKPVQEEIVRYGHDYFGDEFQFDEGLAFFDYFESNGWKVSGKAQMKDWQAALRNWHRNKDKFKNRGGK